ncbi:GTP-binding protein HflX [Platysternon megacephalum]|uniref:GTP-binding protein HflX n=1 Tax=Platysternon megacephalum TaxID=55544 RepID=A0A4D9DF02_9SAUR|nr:GTP-binding protein HflX [Platysternon megacephalum]
MNENLAQHILPEYINKSATITGLEPGTLYEITVFAQIAGTEGDATTIKTYTIPLAADNVTKGDLTVKRLYTKPSAVSELKVINIGTREVTLAWQNSDAEASKYTYWILSSPKNITSPDKSATITGLEPGTLYEITVFAQIAGTEGDATTIKTYTSLKDCSSINVNATTTEINIDTKENLTISNVTFANGTLFQNSSLTNSIGGLSPGVQYIINFQNGTEACSKKITTMPTPVFNIEVSNVSTDEVSLTWENKDAAASEYSYRILIGNESSSARNMIVNSTKAVIPSLNPGTLYRFTIFPRAADNKTEGHPNRTSIYTMPTPVFNIEVSNVSTDEVSLTWENKDAAASEYSYRILIGNESSSARNMIVNSTKAVIPSLNPGTLYRFTIFPRAADNKTEGHPNWTSIYTSKSFSHI